MKILLIPIMCLGLLASCAPVIYMTVVSKDYDDLKPTSASLCIAPFRNLSINYSGNVTEEFGKGDQDELILNHFTSTLISNLKTRSSFASASIDTPLIPVSFKQFSFNIGDKLTLDLPADSVTIRFKQSTPDFILFIQDISIGTENLRGGEIGYELPGAPQPAGATLSAATGGVTSYSMNGSGQHMGFSPPPMPVPAFGMAPVYQEPSDKYLRYTCGFAFWDNHRHAPAIFGRIMAKSRAESHALGMVQVIKMDNWNEIDEKFIGYLLKRTPLEKKPVF